MNATILHALSADVVTHMISTYLDCVEFWRLRQTCKSFAPLIKPPPSFTYKLVVATITDGFMILDFLFAETLANAMEALHAMYEANYEMYADRANGCGTTVNLRFINFVVGEQNLENLEKKRQPRKLLLYWPTSEYYAQAEDIINSTENFHHTCDVEVFHYNFQLFAHSPDGEETRNGHPSEYLMAHLLWLNSTPTFASNCESGHLQHIYFNSENPGSGSRNYSLFQSHQGNCAFYDLEGESRQGEGRQDYDKTKKNSVCDGTFRYEHQVGTIEKWRTTDTVDLWDTM